MSEFRVGTDVSVCEVAGISGVTVDLTLPDFGYSILQTHRKHRSFSGNMQREIEAAVLFLKLFTLENQATDCLPCSF
jgi:hypothetical protein